MVMNLGQHVERGQGATTGIVKTHAQAILELLERYGCETCLRRDSTPPPRPVAKRPS